MWPYSAGCGLTCRLAVSAMAGWSLAQPRVCGRWLPVRLPGKSLAALMLESKEACAGLDRESSATTPGSARPPLG